MSLPLEQLNDQTLKRLNIPNKTVESPQGLDTLYLQKVLNLTYVVNDIFQVPHKIETVAAADIGASGRRFVTPINIRRILFNMRLDFVATATVGNRSVVIQKRNKVGDAIRTYIVETVTASQSRSYQVSCGTASGAVSVHVELNFPEVLEPEWEIRLDDTANIDNLDDGSYTIEYLEILI